MNDLIHGPYLKKIPYLPNDGSGPVFSAPWEAKVFAMTLDLHQQGLFDWIEWCDTLSKEIKMAQIAGDPDLGDTYYQYWLGALEKLITKKKVTSMKSLIAFKEDWRTADHHRGFGEVPSLVKGSSKADNY